MRKSLIRIVALLLVPCLTLEPISASGLSSTISTRNINTYPTQYNEIRKVFECEALEESIWRVITRFSRKFTARVNRITETQAKDEGGDEKRTRTDPAAPFSAGSKQYREMSTMADE